MDESCVILRRQLAIAKRDKGAGNGFKAEARR
jgi:hypothetical protein